MQQTLRIADAPGRGAGSETLKELKQGGAFEIRAIVALANPGATAELNRPQAPLFDIDVNRCPAARAQLRNLFNREQALDSSRERLAFQSVLA